MKVEDAEDEERLQGEGNRKGEENRVLGKGITGMELVSERGRERRGRKRWGKGKG